MGRLSILSTRDGAGDRLIYSLNGIN